MWVRILEFNQSLLDDTLFRTRTEEFTTDFFRHNIGTADPFIVWDTFKCAFRGHAIQYSSIKQKQFRSKESILTKEIEGLTVQLDSNKNCTIEAQNKLEENQKEMEELIQDTVQYIIKIKRTRWNMGENAPNYFSIFNIEMLPKKCINFFLQMMESCMIHSNIFLEKVSKHRSCYHEKENTCLFVEKSP